MNFSMFVLAVLAVVGLSAGANIPYENVPDIDLELSDPNFEQPIETDEASGIRQRRATCDLLSVSLPWGSLNHSACAAHCLAMRKGFRGGRCIDGVCNCRR